MKSQAAIEYMAVVVISLLLVTPFILLAQKSIKDMESKIDLIGAKETLDKIGDAAKIVYSQGDPAKLTVDVKFPKNIKASNITHQMMYFIIETNSMNNTIFKLFDFDINGTLPTDYGTHTIVLSNINNVVNISYTS